MPRFSEIPGYFDFSTVVEFFEENKNVVNRQELIETFDVSKSWPNEYITRGTFVQRSDGTLGLSEKAYEKFQIQFEKTDPASKYISEWRPDKNFYKPKPGVDPNVARNFIREKVLQSADHQGLLVKDFSFENNNKYKITFYPASYEIEGRAVKPGHFFNRETRQFEPRPKATVGERHILKFDRTTHTLEDALRKAKDAAGKGLWSLRDYFKNLHNMPDMDPADFANFKSTVEKKIPNGFSLGNPKLEFKNLPSGTTLTTSATYELAKNTAGKVASAAGKALVPGILLLSAAKIANAENKLETAVTEVANLAIKKGGGFLVSTPMGPGDTFPFDPRETQSAPVLKKYNVGVAATVAGAAAAVAPKLIVPVVAGVAAGVIADRVFKTEEKPTILNAQAETPRRNYVQSPVENFSPETSFDKLNERVQKQSDPLIFPRDDATPKKPTENIQRDTPKPQKENTQRSTPKKPTVDAKPFEELHGNTFLNNLFRDAPAKAQAVKKTVTNHFKKRLEKDPTASKEKLIKELQEQHKVDPARLKTLEAKVDEMEQSANSAVKLVDNFNGRKAEFEFFSNLRDMHESAQVLGQAFQATQLIAALSDSPKVAQAAQFGFSVCQVAQKVVDVIAAQALYKVSEITSMALTGNYIGLVLSMLSCILPFLSMGPSIAEVTLEYLKDFAKYVSSHLLQHDKRFDHIDAMLTHIINLIDRVLLNQQNLAQQLKDVHDSIQLMLEIVLDRINLMYTLAEAGFKELTFEKLKTTLRKIGNLLFGKDEDVSQVGPLMRTLVDELIVEMSNSDFHTGKFLFDKTFDELITVPQGNPELLTFTLDSPIDDAFVSNPVRHTQALRLKSIFERAAGNFYSLIGFFVAYAQSMLADEEMSLAQIETQIKLIETEKTALSQEKDPTEKTPDEIAKMTEAEYTAFEGAQTKQHQKVMQGMAFEKRLNVLRALKAKRTAQNKNKNTDEDVLKAQVETLTHEVQMQDAIMQQQILDCNIADQTPVPPLPREAQPWIEAHQKLEVARINLLQVQQANRNAPPEKPTFTALNPVIWANTVKRYLEVLDNPVLSQRYRDADLSDFNNIMQMGENHFSLIQYIRKKPMLFKQWWRSYVHELLSLRKFYIKRYEEYAQKLNITDKETLMREAELKKTTVLRVDEKNFVVALQQEAEFKRHLSTFDAQKTLLDVFCYLFGAPEEVIKTLATLPNGDAVIKQLQNVVDLAERPSFADGRKIFVTVNSVFGKLSVTVFNKTFTGFLPPENTPIGAPAAPMLAQLRWRNAGHQAEALSNVFSDAIFSTTYKDIKDINKNEGESIRTNTNPAFSSFFANAAALDCTVTPGALGIDEVQCRPVAEDVDAIFGTRLVHSEASLHANTPPSSSSWGAGLFDSLRSYCRWMTGGNSEVAGTVTGNSNVLSGNSSVLKL